MAHDDPMNWMWLEAMAMLKRAERLRHEAFFPRRDTGRTFWEPLVDILETETELLFVVGLPGVRDEDIETAIEGGALVVRGRRGLSPKARAAFVHRLELPRGPFERRIPLPAGRYGALVRRLDEGCLFVSLRKAD